jgi:hypothetical protein
LRLDHVGAVILPRGEASLDSAEFQNGAVEPAIPIQAIASRTVLLREMPRVAVKKNACTQARFPMRKSEPRSAVRDFAGYETTVDLLPPLLSRAIAKARARRPHCRLRNCPITRLPEPIPSLMSI